MAAGDKVFIADKPTLDEVNSKIGETSNSGGTAGAGTLFAKINAIFTNLDYHVRNWTMVRAAKVDNLDSTVSSRQSEANAASRYNTLNSNTAVNNTASATGTLSQKLSHIINLIASSGQKKLASKVVNFTTAAAGTHTILNITGGGVFEFAYTSMGGSNGALTFEVDGQSQTFNAEVGSKYVGKSLYYPGALLYMAPSSSSTTTNFPAMRPLHFSNSLKITVVKSDTAEQFFRGNYSVYE